MLELLQIPCTSLTSVEKPTIIIILNLNFLFINLPFCVYFLTVHHHVHLQDPSPDPYGLRASLVSEYIDSFEAINAANMLVLGNFIQAKLIKSAQHCSVASNSVQQPTSDRIFWPL